MINKIAASLREAVAPITDGSSVMITGFGDSGLPRELIDALIEHGAGDLTIISNNAGTERTGLARLLELGRVRKIICSYPKSSGSVVFTELYRAGKIELELVPQGTLSERMRAGAAGIGGFYVKTAVGTKLAQGKEVREMNGETYVLELPIKGDIARCRADRAERWGNLTFRKSARNFNPVMAMAADTVIVTTENIVPVGVIAPDHVVTPGPLVDYLVGNG
jgi:3-oxoadipate CoA-transferase alpha subunit